MSEHMFAYSEGVWQAIALGSSTLLGLAVVVIVWLASEVRGLEEVADYLYGMLEKCKEGEDAHE